MSILDAGVITETDSTVARHRPFCSQPLNTFAGVKGRANCTTCGRVKVYHLSEGIGCLVGSVIPVSGIIKEPASGQPTQDGDRNFNIDTV